MSRTKKNKTSAFPKYIACCFQGGGAMGAYQVGVLHALDEAGYAPDWFVGTSIGAINAAIAAGNPEKLRIEKMYQFWKAISTPTFMDTFIPDDIENRKLQHLLSSQSAIFFGQPGFFKPRFPPVIPGWSDSPDKLSYYDTCELKNTLEQYIDFDRINSEATRLCVGAVEIASGEMVYFDSHHQKIGPEHIMASGALPPGFPAVEVEGKYYWDGGISSNSPSSYVLSSKECPQNLLCFTIHLFDSYGLNPTTLDEVMMRKKDIEFSSRYTTMIQLYQQVHALKNSIHLLSRFVPEDKKSNPELKLCISRGQEATISLVRFLYEKESGEFASKDYEFSGKSIFERIKSGYRDGKKAIKKSPWLEPITQTTGIALYDMSPNKHLKKAENEAG